MSSAPAHPPPVEYPHFPSRDQVRACIESGDYDAILWATGFNVRLPFLADDLVRWDRGVPVRRAAGILPEGVEQLYFVGLSAPRGPQIPIYGVQIQVVVTMIDLARSGALGEIGIAERFEALQPPETRVDIVRAIWLDQLADTRRCLEALGSASIGRTTVAAGATRR